MTAITYAMAENGKEKGTFYVGVQVEKYSISARLEAYVEQGVTYILDTSNMSMIGSTLNWEQNDIEETDLDQFLRDFNLSDETAEIDKNMKQTESFYLEAKGRQLPFFTCRWKDIMDGICAAAFLPM